MLIIHLNRFREAFKKKHFLHWGRGGLRIGLRYTFFFKNMVQNGLTLHFKSLISFLFLDFCYTFRKIRGGVRPECKISSYYCKAAEPMSKFICKTFVAMTEWQLRNWLKCEILSEVLELDKFPSLHRAVILAPIKKTKITSFFNKIFVRELLKTILMLIYL